MARGKQTCKILKEIRKQIAAENDIKLVIEECTYQGDCRGTCPKCEAEVRYLERELEKRQRVGKAAVIAGMAVGTMLTATSCDRIIPQPLEGDVPYIPDSTEMPNDSISNDSIPSDAYLLEGDVLAPEPDTMKADEKKTACKADVELVIPGDIVEVDGEIGEYLEPLEGIIEDTADEGEPFAIVDQMPEFPGGQEALDKYIQENLRCGEMINKYQVDAVGKIFVGFIIEPDGSITNVRVLRGLYKHYDEEAIRVVKSMPKWKPGMQNGEAVRVSYLIPINFKLEDQQD